MNYKRLGGLLIFLCLISFPVSASMVSFLMVETGLREEAPSTQYGSVWEGGLMDAFFNAGHIVTNSPMARMDYKPEGLTRELEADLDDAILGGAEFFVLGFLDYGADGGRTLPNTMILYVYSTGTRDLIYQAEFIAGSGRSLDEEYRIAQSAGQIIINYIRNR